MAKGKRAPAVAAAVFTPMSKLDLLPGDVVELSDGRTLTTTGILAGSMAFKAPGASAFTWPAAETPMRVVRSPNRERKVEVERDADPLRDTRQAPVPLKLGV